MKNLKSLSKVSSIKLVPLILLGLILTFCSSKTIQSQHFSIKEFSLLGYINDGHIYPVCCLCVTAENCPCPLNCGLFDKKIYKISDVVQKYNVKISDREKGRLTMYKLKNITPYIKDSKTYEWIGKLHNFIVKKSLDKLEVQIKNWKRSNRKPTNDEVETAVKTALIETYKELGLSKVDYATFRNETYNIFELKEAPKFRSKKFKNLSKALISNSINNNNKVYKKSVIKKLSRKKLGYLNRVLNSNSPNTEKTAYSKSAIRKAEQKLDNEYGKMRQHSFVRNKIGISVLKASNDLWTTDFIDELLDKYLGNGSGEVASMRTKKDVKDVVKSDVGGAAAGATAGAVTGAGAAAGAVAIGAGMSVKEVVTKILDWLW